MAEDSFILMNIKDSKEIAAAIQNDTAHKILDFLTKGKATESEIAESLNIPMSTVHYNLQQLKKAKLVLADEYHYSKKGKEILHYKLAKKLIIIAPGGEENDWKKLLRRIIPAFGIVVIVGWIVRKINVLGSYSHLMNSGVQTKIMPMAASTAGLIEEDAATRGMAGESSNLLSSSYQTGFWHSFSAFEWFILGAFCIIVTLLIIELFLSKQWFRSKKHSE